MSSDFEARVMATEEALFAAVRARDAWVTGDGRIGESLLAELLGMRPDSLANKRLEGSAPPHFRLGGGGHKVTYRIRDAAAWLEGFREVAPSNPIRHC